MNPIISLVTGLFGGFVDDWKAKRQDQREIERAVVENKIRLAQLTVKCIPY